MPKYGILLVAVFLGLLSVQVSAQNKVDIFGYYTIVKPPRAFSDISEIHLSGDYGAGLKPPIHGLIRLKSERAKDFFLYKPFIRGSHIEFKSKSVGGVEYRFTGRFTRLGDFPNEQPNGESLLSGKLSKFKGKTKLAEAVVNFSYYAGH